MNTESTKETEVSLVSCSKKKGKQMYLIYAEPFGRRIAPAISINQIHPFPFNFLDKIFRSSSLIFVPLSERKRENQFIP